MTDEHHNRRLTCEVLPLWGVSLPDEGSAPAGTTSNNPNADQAWADAKQFSADAARPRNPARRVEMCILLETSIGESSTSASMGQ